MIVRAFAVAVVLLLTPTPADVSATVGDAGTPPPVTFNEFLPEDRGLGECISALPRPGCGSEARGGWRQGLVLLAILAGLAFIAWRIAVSARRRPDDDARTPTPTTVPDADDDERTPRPGD